MSYPLPLTRTEAYLAYKAGVIQQSGLKPSLAVPRNGIDAWLAYWTGLAADYPQREDGTPHILQEEEAYIAYLCGVINEYPEKCLRRVGAYLRYLISSRWGRPDHPLNREELYLSLIKTQFIPSGDPSSDIVIDGTAKAPFVDVRLYGDTLQQGNTAKSLLNTKSETEETDEEIKTVIPDDKTIELEATETPTVKAAVKSEAKIEASYDEKSEAGYDEIATPTVEEDSTAISYEKSTSVQSNPSPDSPQPIQTVTGEQTVSIIGKNLFDKDTPLSNKYIDASGNWITGQTIYIVQEYKAIPISTYSFSFSSKVGSAYIRFAEYDSGGNFTKRTLVDTTNTTITLRSDTHKIAWSIDARMDAGAYSTYFTDLQIEVGTTATAYEPYNPRDYKINLGKNLFDATATPWSSKVAYDANGDFAYWTGYVGIVGYQPVEPNSTYTFSNSTGKAISYGLVFYDAGKNKISNVSSVTRTFTTPANCHYVRFAIQNGSIPTWTQLELGSTATPYAPYFTPIELCKLGEYQDYIWKDEGDWKIHKAISKYVFDGSQDEEWIVTGDCFRPEGVAFNGLIYDPVTTNAKSNLATVWKNSTGSITRSMPNLRFGWAASGTKKLAVRFDKIKQGKPDSEALESWINILSGTPMAVYFEALSASDIIIDNVALVSQLEALVAGGAENGTTYIKVNATDPNLPGLLYVEAPKYE